MFITGPDQINCTWERPTAGNADLSYEISWEFGSAVISSTNYSISGLVPNTEYNISIVAINSDKFSTTFIQFVATGTFKVKYIYTTYY